MKILCAFYQIQNPGGITNHQEVLGAALQALGHTVEIRTLCWTATITGTAEPRRTLKQEIGISSGMQLDQSAGWFWPRDKRIAYKGAANLAKWGEFSSKFDLIIWQTPVPTLRNDSKGNSDWVGLYDTPVKQIAVIHDGNIERCPWLYLVKDHLAGLVGVHPAAFVGAGQIPIRSALIANPHWEPLLRAKQAVKSGREGWVSVQTFKEWKRVPELVRAITYMGGYPKVVAGTGPDFFYMTSKDKVRRQGLASRYFDPDLAAAAEGERIWSRALHVGMDYRGCVTNAERDAMLRKAKYLIDPSWSKKYAQAGDHFNRTPIEGIIAGCVPIARNLGISDNEQGNGLLFKAGVNYHMIPWDATPKQFGTAVDEILAQSERKRLQMLEAAREILPHFDALTVAQAYIDFAKGKKPAGALKYCSKGVENATMIAKTKEAMEGHFARN